MNYPLYLMVFSILLLIKRKEKSLYLQGKAIFRDFYRRNLDFSLDLDVWINEPPSESEDETPVMNIRHENNTLFSGEPPSTDYAKAKVYVEPNHEELAKQRESRKQSEQMNPFYLKDTKKNKAISQVEEK